MAKKALIVATEEERDLASRIIRGMYRLKTTKQIAEFFSIRPSAYILHALNRYKNFDGTRDSCPAYVIKKIIGKAFA